MRIFRPALTVWSKRPVYAARGMRLGVMRFVEPAAIATPSTVRARSSRASRRTIVLVESSASPPVVASVRFGSLADMVER
jgi:hypothetical protein